MCILYVIITKFLNYDVIGPTFDQYPVVSLFSKEDRFKYVTMWCDHLNKINIPIDIEKFDNNVRLWMLQTIVSSLGMVFKSVAGDKLAQLFDEYFRNVDYGLIHT